MSVAARKSEPSPEKRFQEICLSLDGKRLLFLFEDGQGFSVAREHLPGDDRTPITSIQIFDHRCAVAISQASGHCYDLPWDSVRHYAGGGRQRTVSIGRQLKRLRSERGQTQQEVARAAGMSRVQLSRIESNASKPSIDTLLALARALDVPPSTLLVS